MLNKTNGEIKTRSGGKIKSKIIRFLIYIYTL